MVPSRMTKSYSIFLILCPDSLAAGSGTLNDRGGAALDMGQHFRREQLHVSLRFFERHSTVLENADKFRRIHHAGDIAQHLDALRGSTVRLRRAKHITERLGIVLGRVGHLCVVLVTFGIAEMLGLVVLVMSNSSIGVVAHPLLGAFDRFLFGLRAVHKADHDRTLRDATEFGARLLEVGVILLMLVPRLLRN